VEDVVAREPLVGVDAAVLRFFHSHGEPFLTPAMIAFEALFSPAVLLPAAVAIGSALVVLAYRRKAFEMGFGGTVLLATAVGTGVLSELFELLFHRPPPPTSLQLVYQTDYVFPSSHAMAAVAVGAAAWYLWGLRPEGT
jgi:undecaprenyl-diphosphatase